MVLGFQGHDTCHGGQHLALDGAIVHQFPIHGDGPRGCDWFQSESLHSDQLHVWVGADLPSGEVSELLQHLTPIAVARGQGQVDDAIVKTAFWLHHKVFSQVGLVGGSHLDE